MPALRRTICRPLRPIRVANAEMLSLTARRRLVRSRTGRSRHHCPKSGMRHIAPGGRIDRRHADFGGPGQMAGSVRGTDENAMTQIDDWEVFRTYTDQGS